MKGALICQPFPSPRFLCFPRERELSEGVISLRISMAPKSESLDALRARIDEIDDRVHQLLMERTAVVEAVARAKQNGPRAAALRPGREAAILRRLMGLHQGAFPRGAIVRIWRELISAQLSVQTQFAVAVYMPSDAASYWDLARDHFGSHTPMTAFRSIGQVVRAVTESPATVGVLPMPQEGEPDPWWRGLASRDEQAPRVFARLPFGPRGNVRGDSGDALAIGCVAPEPTGADRSLLVVESGGGMSRTRLFSTLAAVGLPCTFFAAPEQRPEASLVEVEGFVTDDDERLKTLVEQLGDGIGRALPIGAYALPLGPTETANP
jgi:chorismate mutase-like protein